MWSLIFLPKPCMCVSERESVCVCVVPVFWEVFLSGWNSSNSHECLEPRLEAHWVQVTATSRHDTEQLGRQQADLFRVGASVLMCLCVGVFFSCQILLELITPPAPDLRSLGRRTEGAATCTYKSLNNTQSPCFSTFRLTDWQVTNNLGVQTVAWQEPVGKIWSILLLSNTIMQVLPFYDYYELFTLNYKESL